MADNLYLSKIFYISLPKIYSISKAQNLELFTDRNEKTIFQKFQN